MRGVDETMLTDRDIICFANDWQTDPTSKHHLLKGFAAENDVLWVEAAGMRKPDLGSSSDLRRIVRKVRSFTRPARQVLPRLHAYGPPVVPLPGSSWARAVNRKLYSATIAREARRIGLGDDPLIWVYGPHVAPLIRELPRSFLLYHCVDRWAAFDDYDAELMVEFEREICERADLVIASAEDLADHCRTFADNVHYVPHGVDHAHFARALEDGEEPAELADIPAPRIGFFGLLHEWVDLDLVGWLADRMPHHFVLIGASNQDTTALEARDNVHLLGRKPFGELPAYARGFAAAIVPFRLNELTVSVNPIKLREYAAAGLPIVSTGLPEVRRCGDIVECADTPEEWMAALERAVERGTSPEWRRDQSAAVLDQDWSAVCRRISGLIVETESRGAAAQAG